MYFNFLVPCVCFSLVDELFSVIKMTKSYAFSKVFCFCFDQEESEVNGLAEHFA